MSTREQEMWYVTQHFSDLQGLRSAPILAGLLPIVYLVPRGPKHWEHTLLIFAGLLLFVLLWLWWSFRWYKEHYGLVVPAVNCQPEIQPGRSIAYWLIFVICIGCTISLRDSFVPLCALNTAGTFILPKCFFRVPVNFAIQFRRALYIAGMFAAIGSVLYLTYTRTGSGFIVIYVQLWLFLLFSLYDHWLLNHCARGDMKFSKADLSNLDSEPFLNADQMVHEPAWLAIFTVLAACKRADFLFLERATRLSRDNLLGQLWRLEEAGLVEIEKTIKRKRTLTTAALTGPGRVALEAYWRTVEGLRVRSQQLAEA